MAITDDAFPLGTRATPSGIAAMSGWLCHLLLLGLYLTLRGYHSLDGDQAYRLPLLLHQQDPGLYAADPFVRAFDGFNPHRGSLLILGTAAGFAGLSGGLLTVFVATFLVTCRGLDRLARAVVPGSAAVGAVAIALVLLARAGNLGTNHLFEAMVLDRLMALAAGWLAIAALVTRPDQAWWQSGLALALATLIHPSLGLQLALVISGTWIAWTCLPGVGRVTWLLAGKGILAAGLAVLPGLAINGAGGAGIQQGLKPDAFWTLAVELQSPQHMLPHLWRVPQWLAAGCYLVLAGLALPRTWAETPARRRLALMLGVILAWLGGAWVAIELFHTVRITIFQPFRMATLARGLCLVLVAGRVIALWDRGSWLARLRALLMTVGLTGDWMLVVVTAAELCATLAEAIHRKAAAVAFAAALGAGLLFLSRHDTESGHWPLLATVLGWGALAIPGLAAMMGRLRESRGIPNRRALLAMTWTVPALAMAANLAASNQGLGRTALVQGLVARCRFAAVPVDDVERLGAWCRDHTPPASRFIGPPGPKTFRLWSRRSLAFNRAASPYHAAGLADWFARFQAHVGIEASPNAFVRAYLADRHGLEARYDALTDEQKAGLARRQGADHVVASAPREGGEAPVGPLELLHVEGQRAVYRVRPELASRTLSQTDPQRH